MQSESCSCFMTRCKATCLKLLINGNDALHSLKPLPHGSFMTTIVRGNGRYQIHLAQTADACRYAYRHTPAVLRIDIGLTRFSHLLCPMWYGFTLLSSAAAAAAYLRQSCNQAWPTRPTCPVLLATSPHALRSYVSVISITMSVPMWLQQIEADERVP